MRFERWFKVQQQQGRFTTYEPPPYDPRTHKVGRHMICIKFLLEDSCRCIEIQNIKDLFFFFFCVNFFILEHLLSHAAAMLIIIFPILLTQKKKVLVDEAGAAARGEWICGVCRCKNDAIYCNCKICGWVKQFYGVIFNTFSHLCFARHPPFFVLERFIDTTQTQSIK